MYKIETTRTVKMKCDICGKYEEVTEGARIFPGASFWKKKWTEVRLVEAGSGMDEPKKLHLCPKCTRKFKKLVAAVEIEEHEE